MAEEASKKKRKVEKPKESEANKLCEGALCGEFYVGANKKVRFSKGNLQFNALQGTHETADGKLLRGTWRFAEHQWDTIGLDNKNIAEDYNGWIDLFGWGTSGWNRGYSKNDPWYANVWTVNYLKYSLVDKYKNADWGVYNTISNGGGEPNKWRTLTGREWDYLIKNNDWVLGEIEGKLCVLLIPEGVSDLVSTEISGLVKAGSLTAKQFEKYEVQGVVALPCGGFRHGDYEPDNLEDGNYWSSSSCTGDDDRGCCFFFSSKNVSLDYKFRKYGMSVRLVQDVKGKGKTKSPKKSVASNFGEGSLCGEFLIGKNKKVRFSKGNLQFNKMQGTHKTADGKELPGTWRFAEHQWDTIGDGNEEVGEYYDGFIDLFGYGTSGWNSGAKRYLPWSTSSHDEYYDPRALKAFTKECANVDWGRYNAISNGGDTPGQWRVLKYTEWLYLLKHNRWSMGRIDGKLCFLLIPEIFFGIDEISIGKKTCEFKNYDYDFINFTGEEFKKYEEQGVVALPCGGRRKGTSVSDVGSLGTYWSSDSDDAYGFSFESSWRATLVNHDIYCGTGYSKFLGRSVRLVQNV